MLAVVKRTRRPGLRGKRGPLSCPPGHRRHHQSPFRGHLRHRRPILAGTRPVPYPLIPGHEFAGDIVEVGSAVQHLKVETGSPLHRHRLR